MLDREVRLAHHGSGGFRGRDWLGGHLSLRPGQRFGRVPIHRVCVQQPRQPLDFLFVFPIPLGELGETAECDDILAVELEHLLEDAEGGRIIFLVDEATGVDDVGADVIGVELEAVLAEVDRVIYKPRFTIGIREGRKIASLGIVPKARFEFVDLAGVGQRPRPPVCLA